MRQQERAARLRPVFEYVSQNFAEDFTLKQAAVLANMSQPQFIKLFKRVAGMTFVSYVTHVRITRVSFTERKLVHDRGSGQSRGIFGSELF